jgi:integrase
MASINRCLESATPPEAMQPEVGPPDAKDISRPITAVEKVDPGMTSMLFVAATTGCRRCDLCSLHWSDLEVEKATVTVRRSISDTSRGVQVKNPKTHRARRISLDAATVSVLTNHHKRVEQRARDIGSGLASEAHIWSQEGDWRTLWKPDRVTDAFRTHLKRGDLEHTNKCLEFVPDNLGSDRLGLTKKMGH